MSNSVFALQVSPEHSAFAAAARRSREEFLVQLEPALGQLFRKLDPVLWRKVEGSPRLFLRSVDQGILDHAAADASFIEEYRRILAEFDDYLGGKPAPQDGLERATSSRTSAPSTAGTRASRSTPAAWACSPAITARRPAISKLPFVAVGLLYHQGYFTSAHRPQRPADSRVPADRSAQRAARRSR